MRRPRRRGANAIEFALTFPWMFLGIAGVFDYGLYFSARGHVYQAALEGARAGALTTDPSSAVTNANKQCEAVMNDFGLTAGGCSASPVTVNGEATIQMDVTQTYNGIVVPMTMPDISFRMAMRRESQP